MSTVENYFASMTEMFIDSKPYGDTSLDEKFKKVITPIYYEPLRNMEKIMADKYDDMERAFGMLVYMFIIREGEMPECSVYNINKLLDCVEDILDSKTMEQIVIIAFCLYFITWISDIHIPADDRENLKSEFSAFVSEMNGISRFLKIADAELASARFKSISRARKCCAAAAVIIATFLNHSELANDIDMSELKVIYGSID